MSLLSLGGARKMRWALRQRAVRLLRSMDRAVFWPKPNGSTGEAFFNYAPGRHVYDYATWQQLGGLDYGTAPQTHENAFVWFVPTWFNVWGGGHYTLFRFAAHFAKKGIRQYIYCYDNDGRYPLEKLQADLDLAFPESGVRAIGINEIPSCDAVLATTWQSAYYVRAFPGARRKLYFMQDFESHFYAHGTQSMQANNTYTFGFQGITGGLWNRQQFLNHGGQADAYNFSTDRHIFFPGDENGDVRPTVSRIFFYGRPSTERRCFELGVRSLERIKKRFPDVEIVIAGLDGLDDLPFPVTKMGNLTLAKTGELYRTCDIGIAFSGTNLSYLPVELMACGVPVVSNRGPHVEWYCKDGENALLVDPTPSAVEEAVARLIESQSLRQKLASGGLHKASLTTWEAEMDRIFDCISVSEVA